MRNSLPWYLSHHLILLSLLCPSSLLFKLISSLLTSHTSGISFLYICLAWAVNCFVTFNRISSSENSVYKCLKSIVSILSTKIVTLSSLYLTLNSLTIATLFMTLIEHLIPLGGTIQLLLSKSFKENFKWKITTIYYTRILNHESLNWILVLTGFSLVVLLLWRSAKIGSRFC